MFQEYPKWLYLPDGRAVIVQDAAEEAQYAVAPGEPEVTEADPAPAPRKPGRPRKSKE